VAGGILSGMRRALLGGESIFQQELRCRSGGGGGGGDAVLAAPDPGALAIVPVSPTRGLMAVQGAFVACDAGVAVDAGLRGASALNGLLSQQGMFAVSMRGTGNAVVHGGRSQVPTVPHCLRLSSPTPLSSLPRPSPPPGRRLAGRPPPHPTTYPSIGRFRIFGISHPALCTDALSATLYVHSTWCPLSRAGH